MKKIAFVKFLKGLPKRLRILGLNKNYHSEGSLVMDQSFNEQELSEIMKEIEALEEDFQAKDEKTSSPVLEELASLDEVISIPSSTPKIVSMASPQKAPTGSSSPSTSMSFRVQGELTIDLQFDIGGKVVCLEVSEHGLTIEMDGGAKFTVPVSEKSSLKKAV